GGAGEDVALAVPETAEESDIATALAVPESQVLRIKRALGNDWLVGERLPVDAVGRGVGVHRRAGHRLVALFGRSRGVRVPERGEVVREITGAGENDVVLFRAFELDDAEFRLGPTDPVAAFGVAGQLGVLGASQPAIVHAVFVAVL